VSQYNDITMDVKVFTSVSIAIPFLRPL